MIFDVAEDKLLVISDLHLGSPASTAQWRVADFLEYARAGRWNLCINGDGFDLLQSRLARFLAHAGPISRRLQRLTEDGLRVYYTLGNHDIPLEHVLGHLPVTMAPFLNVRSGDKRIRIEHGHLYEPFYSKHPDLYEFGGRLGRSLLFMHADIYEIWAKMQLKLDIKRRASPEATYPHYDAAHMLYDRGFDATVFGHTHLPEIRKLDEGLFVNSGSWMKGGEFVRIENGHIQLESWHGRDEPTRVFDVD